VFDRGHVSTRFNIVDLESTIRIGCVGLTIGLAVTLNELHTCFSYGLASGLLQDLASYRYARSLLLRGTLKCEGDRYEAKSSDQKMFQERPRRSNGRSVRAVFRHITLTRHGPTSKQNSLAPVQK
jgi:hypothetical protein